MYFVNKGQILDDLKEFFHTLSIYEYAGFGIAFLLFLILFFAAIAMRKRIGMLLLFLMLSFVVLGVSPITIKYVVNTYMKKTEITLTTDKKLQYINTVIIAGKLKNTGMMDYKKRCIITAKLVAKSSNPLKQVTKELKPLRKKELVIDEWLAVGEETKFKIIIDDFDYQKPFMSIVKAECW